MYLLHFLAACVIIKSSHEQTICSSNKEGKEKVERILATYGVSPECLAEALASYKSDSSPNNSNSVSEKDKTRARDCHELQALGYSSSGVQTIYPYDCGKDRKVVAYCDQTTDGGGWTVIQNRDNLTIREDFYRTWIEYSLGFGNVSGEFWLGLNNIHALVSSTLMEMRVDMEDYDGVKRFAKYGFFYVGDESTKYTLRVGKYTGDAGDGITHHNGQKFSTHDQDNDPHPTNVAETYKGAHWYTAGHTSNFNGYQYIANHQFFATGIDWQSFRGHYYSLKKINLKVRPAFR